MHDQQNDEPLIHFLQDLVRIKTLSGTEQAGIERVAQEMKHLSFDEVSIDNYGNVVGIIQGQYAGPTVLMDAHIDTVPIASGVTWEHDPFGANIVGDRMYGRGTSDMKGSLAAMVYAASSINRSNLAGRVAVSASVMEEVLEGIPLKPIVDKVKPDFVIIGEATSLNLNIGGRGRAELHLQATGRPTHSSMPHLGTNAIHLMIRAIEMIESIEMPTDPFIGAAVLGLTDIISDPHPGNSVIPSRCYATYDRRLVPGETEQTLFTQLQPVTELQGIDISIGQGKYQTYTGAEIACSKFFPAWKLDADHPLVQKSITGLKSAGIAAELGSYQFNTNAAYTAGMLEIPTIGFGPSTEDQAHQVDEHIELAQLRTAATGFSSILTAVLSR